MDLKIAARMIVVLAIGSAMIAAVATLREDGTEETAPAQSLRNPGGEPASAELVRCRDLGMAAASDAACKRAWVENRRRFLGTRERQRTDAPKPERFGPGLPSANELLPAPTKDMDRLPSGNTGAADARGAGTMNDVGVIDRFLETFTSYIDSGFGLLGGEVAFLTTTLIVIDITLAGLFWAWGADEDVLQRLIRKTLYIGFFAFIIGNFNSLAAIVFESFSGLGLQAGSSSLSGSELLQPGRVAQVGIDAGNPILEAAGQLMGYISFFENFVQIMVLMIAWAVVLIAFFILAVQIFVTLIEFKLTTLAGFVLIPFALFNKTAFLAEKVLGNIVASGVKILVLAVIVGIGSGLFGEFTTGFAEQPTITDALALMLGALSLMGLSIFGPGIATGLVSGTPQLGAGAAVGTGLAVAGMGAAGFMGARAAAGSAAGAISAGGRMSAAAARGGAHLAGSSSTAYGLAASTSGQTGMGAVAAGIGGIAKAGAGAAAQPVKHAMSRAAEALNSSFRSGRAGAWSATGGQSPVAGMADAAKDVSSNGGAAGASPAWAARMKRGHAMSHGATAAAHAIRSGDHGGGSMNVSLDQDDRR